MVKDFPALGIAGEVREVADGYAKNYLIPKGIALPATPQNLKAWELKRQALERKLAHRAEELKALAGKLEGMTLEIKAKAGSGGRLYGSITSADIADELQRLGVGIDRRQIEMAQPIKEVGTHEVTVRLGPNLTVKIKVEVAEGGERETAS